MRPRLDQLDGGANPGVTGQRVLVTGAGGFVGRHLVRRLHRAGASVIPLTRQTCDLTDPDAVRRVVRDARPDVVMHLAAARQAATSTDRLATTAVNTLSGVWVIEALSSTCRSVIRLGSSTEYAAADGPMDERTPLQPRGFFGATKAAGSLLFAAAAGERGIRATVLRAFQVYGPDDKPARFVPTVLAAAAHGTAVALTVPGMRRDWVWVEDVIDACLLAAAIDGLPAGAVYNIGTGVQTTNEELVAVAEEVTGRSITVAPDQHPGRSWDTANWVSDPNAARAELNWEPRVTLREGLARCWAALSITDSRSAAMAAGALL